MTPEEVTEFIKKNQKTKSRGVALLVLRQQDENVDTVLKQAVEKGLLIRDKTMYKLKPAPRVIAPRKEREPAPEVPLNERVMRTRPAPAAKEQPAKKKAKTTTTPTAAKKKPTASKTTTKPKVTAKPKTVAKPKATTAKPKTAVQPKTTPKKATKTVSAGTRKSPRSKA